MTNRLSDEEIAEIEARAKNYADRLFPQTECAEQMAVSDIPRLLQEVKALKAENCELRVEIALVKRQTTY